MDHFDEELEHYALGLLEPEERDRIDEHVRACDVCAERLGRAEAAVAALVTGSQQRRAWRLPAWPVAVAAAFALTSAVLFGQNVALRGAMNADGHVLDTLVLWTGVERGLLLLRAPDGRLVPHAIAGGTH